MPRSKVPTLKVDPGKYPGLAKNPSLERALRIQQALDAGKSREEAVALAEAAMGRRAPVMSSARRKPVGRPAEGPRPGGTAQAPRKRAPLPQGAQAAAGGPGRRRAVQGQRRRPPSRT